MKRLTSIDVCSGAGGLALGLERAGFDPVLLLDHKPVACETLRLNRPRWNVLEMDLLDFDPVDRAEWQDVDLLSAGLPRVRSSATSRRVETGSERRLLEATALLIHAVQPRALLIENVPGLAVDDDFLGERDYLKAELEHLGYGLHWFVVNAADFGVPQERKQGILVALKQEYSGRFMDPAPRTADRVTVGAALLPSMRSRGWTGADAWAAQADRVAPTLVGGSDNRGGADLGLTGSKRIWAGMGINGGALADEVPDRDGAQVSDNSGSPLKKLTVEQTAVLQAFPPDWSFAGGKTLRYRQIGHASPPPVGEALGAAIRDALEG